MNVVRGWLFDNLGLKVSALLLAVLVYLNVATDRTGTMLVTFPLDFVDLPDSLSLSGPAPAVVQAELRGTLKQLIALRVKEPSLRIPMSAAEPGHFVRSLVPSDLPLPAGGPISVENLVGPKVIEVDVDRRATRDVPVAVRVAGSPATGFEYSGHATVQPARVQVTGPRGVVEGIDSLRVGDVRLDGHRDTLRAVVPVGGLPERCSADPTSVQVQLAIRRARH
jgi:YbbR domain-containing protein